MREGERGKKKQHVGGKELRTDTTNESRTQPQPTGNKHGNNLQQCIHRNNKRAKKYRNNKNKQMTKTTTKRRIPKHNMGEEH